MAVLTAGAGSRPGLRLQHQHEATKDPKTSTRPPETRRNQKHPPYSIRPHPRCENPPHFPLHSAPRTHALPLPALADADAPPQTVLERTRRALAIALLSTLACSLAAPAWAAPPKKKAAPAAAAKSSNHKTYNKAGASFQYPTTWKVVLDETDASMGGIHNVDLEGPDDERITLSFIPFMAGKDIESFAARAAHRRAELAAQEGAAAATATQAPQPSPPPQQQQPPVPPEQEVVSAPPPATASPAAGAATAAPAPVPAPATTSKVSSITPITSSTITRRLSGGKEVKGVLHHFSYVGQDSSVPVEAGFFAMDFSPTSSVTIMTQAQVEHAKSMEAAQILVLGSLRYRPAAQPKQANK